MNFCVLIKISRTSITFWCQQQAAIFEPLARKEGNVIPMYFYVNGNDFIVGKFAKERFLNGDTTCCYGDYFKLIEDPSKYFTIFGNQKHVKFLLYYAVEQYLSHFLNTVLYKNDSIEEYRNSFPLRFMFSSDIVQKERLLVMSIFSESGYDNVDTLSYLTFLFQGLNNQKIINSQLPIILLTGLDGNLYIELFSEASSFPIDEEVLDEQGADPRIKIMAKMLYESAISSNHISLNEKNEIAHLLHSAKDFLDQASAIPRGDITLSDGTNCYVQLKKKELNDRLMYYSGEEKIFRAIDNLLKKNSIHENKVQFVLNGEAVNTSYFIERLKKKFSQVIGTPTNIENEVLKLAFKNIAEANYKPFLSCANKAQKKICLDNFEPKSAILQPPPPPPKPIVKTILEPLRQAINVPPPPPPSKPALRTIGEPLKPAVNVHKPPPPLPPPPPPPRTAVKIIVEPIKQVVSNSPPPPPPRQIVKPVSPPPPPPPPPKRR